MKSTHTKPPLPAPRPVWQLINGVLVGVANAAAGGPIGESAQALVAIATARIKTAAAERKAKSAGNGG